MQSIVRDFRGIPFFLLREYLQELGGVAQGADQVAGKGWVARLERIEPFRLGSLEVGQTQLTVEIEDELVEDFLRRLGEKTLRAGA